MDFFIADTHFNHKNIIEYCDRPFKNIHEMTETMVTRWNEVVKPEDRVFHLGDFSLKISKEDKKLLVSRLNGYKILVKGNHDKGGEDHWKDVGFDEFYADSLVYNEKYLLSHRPLPGSGYFNIHGHVHNVPQPECLRDVQICVSVELFNYYPVSIVRLEELIRR